MRLDRMHRLDESNHQRIQELYQLHGYGDWFTAGHRAVHEAALGMGVKYAFWEVSAELLGSLIDILRLDEVIKKPSFGAGVRDGLRLLTIIPVVGFTFVARQKRITVNGEDFKIDLLLFHRELRRLVVIELKLGRFMPADFGQTEFYLRWLDKYERKPWEESPIGLIFYSEKSNERVELLALDKQEIKVAEYWTQLPDKNLLQQTLHEAVKMARELSERK
jgi:hypothetical protein